MDLMIRHKNSLYRPLLALLAGALCIALTGPAWSDTLPPEVKRSVARWWHAEERSGMPKTDVEVASRAGRRLMRITIDEPDYRGATGNRTYLLYLMERGRWQMLFNTSGLGYFARRGGPGGRPWIETYSHSSAAVSFYELWGWDSRKRAYVAHRNWEGPYPEKMQFVVPPGGLPRIR